LFYNQYVRAGSYFSNSELAAQGLPDGEELALLNRYREQLPEKVFTEKWEPASTVEANGLRKNLIEARDLLAEAGWTIQDGVLKNKQGEVFELNFLLVQSGFDRIIAPYAHNLKKLGIETNYRKVDSSLYKSRLDSFEFDMVVTSFSSSVSPGNELMNMFESASADVKGSNNLPGISDPVVDALVSAIIQAKDREDVVIAARALDRVLVNGEYLVPNWYIDVHRIAYWNKLAMPKQQPLYYDPITWLLKSWWIKNN
ncbi:MAG: ABC transporter substrate-binding protein, partial [Gammaproteobacteria bacterium]|nr:ABC transporter substrate-binding protein [Gammaproteobacteria bacterium]